MTEEEAALPLVSLVIPCHNEERTLERTLAGVARQDYPALEVIVVDDGSTDRTVEVAARFPGVTVLRHRQNRGLSAAYNTGIAAARGGILGTLHADCVPVHPDWVRRCVAHFAAPDIGIVSSPFLIPDRGEASPINYIFMHVLRGDVDAAALRRAGPHEIPFISGKCDFYRTDMLRRLGGFRPLSAVAGEDKDLSLRVRASGFRILLEPRAPVVHLYGSHQQGLLANWSKAVQYGEVVRDLYRLHGRVHSREVVVDALLFLAFLASLPLAVALRSVMPPAAVLLLLALKNAYQAHPLVTGHKSPMLFLLALPIGVVDNLLMGYGVVKGAPRRARDGQRPGAAQQ